VVRYENNRYVLEVEDNPDIKKQAKDFFENTHFLGYFSEIDNIDDLFVLAYHLRNCSEEFLQAVVSAMEKEEAGE
jgi:hypothetical protein